MQRAALQLRALMRALVFSTAWRAFRSATMVAGVILVASIGPHFSAGNSAWASGPGTAAADLKALATGEMAAFLPKAAMDAPTELKFEDGTGKALSLADFKGKVVLLNLWATWCAPCRKEMPAFDRLQSHFKDRPFEIVALSVDRGGAAASRKFLDSVNVPNLKLYVDPTARQHTALRAVGLPTTILFDGQGRELGRLAGAAEWDSEDAKRLIDAALKIAAAQTN